MIKKDNNKLPNVIRKVLMLMIICFGLSMSVLWLLKESVFGEDVSIYSYDSRGRLILYFSVDGNDDNSGANENSPKKDPSAFISCDNTAILLKSGDVFFTPGYTVNAGHNVLITTYGGEKKAVIDGTQKSNSSYAQYKSGIYQVNLNARDIGGLIEDGGYNYKRVSKMEYLKNDGEYFYDTDNGVLYRKSSKDLTGNVATYTFGYYSSAGIGIIEGSEGITVSNLEIRNFANHGIAIGGETNDISIIGCYVHHIGGCNGYGGGARQGNAIQGWCDSENNITITDNVCEYVIDAAITFQDIYTGAQGNSSNLIIKNNYTNNCFYGIELFNLTDKTVDCSIYDNYLFNCIDISGGYRYRWETLEPEIQEPKALKAGTMNSGDKILFSDNICISEEGISLFLDSENPSVYDFNNNVFIAPTAFVIDSNSYYNSTTDIFMDISGVLTKEQKELLIYYQKAGDEKVGNK